DNQLTEPLVEKILDAAGEELLIKAWRARSGDDKEAFKAADGSLLFALSLHRDTRLADLPSKMCRADLDDPLEGPTSGRAQRGGGYSPNVSAFGSLLQECETQAEKLGAHDVAIVHDDQSQYQGAFTKWWAACRTAAPLRFRYPSGNEIKLP